MKSLKKTAFMLSVVLIALGWRVAEPICAHPGILMGCALIAVGGVLFVASVHVLQAPDANLNRFPLLLLAGTCLVLAFQTSYWLRPTYACCAVAIVLPLSVRLRKNRFIMASSIVGTVIMLCGASTILLFHAGWRLHDICVPAVSSTAQRVLSGINSSAGTLTFWNGSHSEKLRLTFESFGLYELWYLGAAAATLALFRKRRPSMASPTRLTIVISAYLAVRFLVLVALATELGESGILWRPIYVVLSWLPLALVLRTDNAMCIEPFQSTSLFSGTSLFSTASPVPSRLSLTGGASRLPAGFLRRGSKFATIIWLFPACAGLFIAVALAYNDPGHEKQGRVLIDETHSNWEWTREPFDTTSFGIRAEYNYFCLRDYLSHFYSVEVETVSLPRGALNTTDVLIIKTPTQPFTAGEIDTIVSFVKRGGGLLLIGDHTNLFGMSAHLNSIAQEFGMKFRYDDTFDLESTGFSIYERPHFWFHPSIRKLKKFEFLTSCTIEGDLATEPLMVGYGLGSEDVDYGHPNFFGNISFDLCDRFGLFLQAAAKRFGRGRVLLFSDSTCFSNFCMFGPGRPELVLGFVDYLNRQAKRYTYARIGTLLVSLAMLSLSFCVTSRQGILVFSGLLLGLFAVSHVNALLYGSVQGRYPVSTVLFDNEHSDVSFFNYLATSEQGQSQQFEQFYMCAQRVRLFPRAGSVKDIAQYKPSAVVIVNPLRHFSANEVKIIKQYVRDGGRLLITDSVTNPGSTANQILAPFGIQLATVPGRARLIDAPGQAESTVKTTQPEAIVPVLAVYGPAETKKDTRGNLVLAVVDVGRGKVAITTDSFRYSAGVLGPPLQRSTPQGQLLDTYRYIFAIYTELTSPNATR